jgi:hypothetical protein
MSDSAIGQTAEHELLQPNAKIAMRSHSPAGCYTTTIFFQSWASLRKLLYQRYEYPSPNGADARLHGFTNHDVIAQLTETKTLLPAVDTFS